MTDRHPPAHPAPTTPPITITDVQTPVALPVPPETATPSIQPPISPGSHLRIGLNMAPRTMKSDINDAKDLGIGIIRVPLQWQTVEPEKGHYDWEVPDSIVKSAKEQNMNVLFGLSSISSWGAAKPTKQTSIYHSSSAPKDMDEWVSFTETIADRYRGQGVSYEIENEVNAPAFWDGTVEEYTELLNASYRAIKKRDPSATVLPSAMACGITHDIRNGDIAREETTQDYNKWLLPILSTKSFDAVSVHDYYFPDAEVNGYTFLTYLDLIRGMMNRAGVGDTPVWITEAGYVSQPTQVGDRTDDGSPDRQAVWLENSFSQARNASVPEIFWLILRDRDEPYFGSMGLSDADGIRKPAWMRLQNFTVH